MSLSKISAAVTILAGAQAKIAKDGLWTGHDWYDDAKMIGVKDGVPYSKNSAEQRRITSPMPVDGDPAVDSDWQSASNV